MRAGRRYCSVQQDLPGWDGWPGGNDPEFDGADEDGGDAEDDTETDGTKAHARQCLPAGGGKTVHNDGNNGTIEDEIA